MRSTDICRQTHLSLPTKRRAFMWGRKYTPHMVLVTQDTNLRDCPPKKIAIMTKTPKG